MVIEFAFWVFLASACSTIFLVGRRPERLFAGVVVIATISTMILNIIFGPEKANTFVISIDVALWLLALMFVVRLDRYWPIWFAAFHSITICTEVGSLMFPGSFPKLYINLAGVWALPALGTAALGIAQDRKLISFPS